MNIPGSGPNTVSHTVTGLRNGTKYEFAVRAVNASGNGDPSLTVEATPGAAQGASAPAPSSAAHPAKPAGLTATLADGVMTLTWNDPEDAGIVKYQYNVQCGVGWGAWKDISGSGARTTSHTISGFTGGTECAFSVRAVNADGVSPPADPASATPARK